VGEIQTEFDVNIVMHHNPAAVNVNPDHALRLVADDTFLVMGSMDHLLALQAANQSSAVPVPTAQFTDAESSGRKGVSPHI
jgi:hypothetical protein